MLIVLTVSLPLVLGFIVIIDILNSSLNVTFDKFTIFFEANFKENLGNNFPPNCD